MTKTQVGRMQLIIVVIAFPLAIILGLVIAEHLDQKHAVSMLTDTYIKGVACDEFRSNHEAFLRHVVKVRSKETLGDITKKMAGYAEVSILWMPYEKERDVSKNLLEFLNKEQPPIGGGDEE